jgi:hypothetical protein
MYRGVGKLIPYGQSQFTRDEIIRAVGAAIAKNADALAGRNTT